MLEMRRHPRHEATHRRHLRADETSGATQRHRSLDGNELQKEEKQDIGQRTV